MTAITTRRARRVSWRASSVSSRVPRDQEGGRPRVRAGPLSAPAAAWAGSLCAPLPQFPQLRLHAALVGTGSASLGRDSGELAGLAATGIALGCELERVLDGAGLVLDFSTAAAAPRQLELCAAAGSALLLGTTGLARRCRRLITRASQRIPLLLAPNTSLGAAVLEALVRQAAVALGPGFDVQDPGTPTTATSSMRLRAPRWPSGRGG